MISNDVNNDIIDVFDDRRWFYRFSQGSEGGVWAPDPPASGSVILRPVRSPARFALSWTLVTALGFQSGCKSDSEAPQGDAGGPSEEAPTPPDPDAEMAAIEAWMKLDAREFPLLIWAAQSVQLEYHDPGRFEPTAQLDAAMDALARARPEFFATREGNALHVTVAEAKKTFELPSTMELRDGAAELEKVLVFVRDASKLEGETLHELEYAALNGYLSPLDPHTILLTPKEHTELGVKTKGRFGGVGIQIHEGERRIVIDEVLPNSPGEKAGLLAGDIIVKIDERATVNMPIVEARELLRGPEGTVVVVVVQREGKKLTLEVTRGVITIDSVDAARLPGDVAYLRISQFQQDTAEKVREALETMGKEKTLAGVVIDLRGNSGGLLTQATAILDLLVDTGELVIVRSATGREAQAAESAFLLGPEIPVVALVDESSASASEIVAGGLRALGRGLVLGRASFGKGTVQMLKPSDPYGEELALKMTVAEYQVAHDTKIQGRGVTPDLRLVPVRLQELAGVAAAYDEERFERERELAISSQLPSAKHDAKAADDAPRGPLVRYLQQTIELAEGEPTAMRDPEIRLAREVVLGLLGSKDPESRLEKLGQLVSKLAPREDTRIADGMRDAWGDASMWGGDPGQGGEASLRVRARRLLTTPVPAGEPFSVELSVGNLGDEVVERVHVLSECNRDELDGIEFIFGRLEPGQTKTERLNLAVLAWHPDLHEELRFDAHVGEPDDEPDGSATLAFDVAGTELPRFGFDMWIVDDPKAAKRAPARPAADPRLPVEPFEVSGNGNGRLDPGERVLLAFSLRNLGPGDAQSPLIRLRNLSGELALLEEGELSFEPLRAGRSVQGSLGLTVGETLPAGSQIDLQVLVGDTHLRERTEKELALTVGDDGASAWTKPKSGADPSALPPELHMDETPVRVEGDTVKISGYAEHPRGVADVVLWVQGPGGPLTERKVAYIPQPEAEGKKPLRFEREVELEPGPNRVRIEARDREGVELQRDLWIFSGPARPDGAEAAAAGAAAPTGAEGLAETGE